MAGLGGQCRVGADRADAGCVVIDNSLHFRDDFSVPLIIPEVNSDELAGCSPAQYCGQPDLHRDGADAGVEADPR